MRLQEVEKGDGFLHALLFRFISIVSGMRLPDAARIVMYHRNFYGKPMTAWTHAAMRGESSWSVGERELFAAMTAKWNSCPFCIKTHGAIASLDLNKTLVAEALEDFQQAKLPPKLYTILEFLEILTKTPDELTIEHVAAIFQKGISVHELEDAMAIITLFSITVRCANTFNFEMLSDEDFSQAARRMLKQGYVFGKGSMAGRPDHRAMAKELRKHVLEEQGLTDVALRQAIAKRANNGPPVSETDYDRLAQQIGQRSYNVTDEQVEKIVRKTGTEKAAFELIAAAAVGSGLYRWQRGLSLLKEVQDKI